MDKTKTAMQELIEDLQKFSPNAGDSIASKALHEGVQWSILKAKRLLELEKKQIIDARATLYAELFDMPINAPRKYCEDYFTNTYNI